MLSLSLTASELKSPESYLGFRLRRSWLLLVTLSVVVIASLLLEAYVPVAVGSLVNQMQNNSIEANVISRWIFGGCLYLLALGGLIFCYRTLFGKLATNDTANLRELFWSKLGERYSAPQVVGIKKRLFANLVHDLPVVAGIGNVFLLQVLQVVSALVIVFSFMATINMWFAICFFSALVSIIFLNNQKSSKYERLVGVQRKFNDSFMEAVGHVAKNTQRLRLAKQDQIARDGLEAKLDRYINWRARSALYLVGREASIGGLFLVLLAVSTVALLMMKQTGLLNTGETLSLAFLACMGSAPIGQSVSLWGSYKRYLVSRSRLHPIASERMENQKILKPFGVSLRDNLSLGSEVSDETLINALRVFELYDELAAQGIGLETSMEPYANKLSLGQRQRLNLCRSYVYKRSVTSDSMHAIDPERRERIRSRLVGS